jgi:hypothetical protein
VGYNIRTWVLDKIELGRRRFAEKWRPGSLFVGGIGKIGARNDVMMSVLVVRSSDSDSVGV